MVLLAVGTHNLSFQTSKIYSSRMLSRPLRTPDKPLRPKVNDFIQHHRLILENTYFCSCFNYEGMEFIAHILFSISSVLNCVSILFLYLCASVPLLFLCPKISLQLKIENKSGFVLNRFLLQKATCNQYLFRKCRIFM